MSFPAAIDRPTAPGTLPAAVLSEGYGSLTCSRTRCPPCPTARWIDGGSGMPQERFDFQFTDEDMRPGLFENLTTLVELVAARAAS